MFVYILGSVEQNIFKLGVAADPFKVLARMQLGNPYRLSIVCRICVRNKNNAALIEGLGRRDLKQYEGAGEWLIDLPAGLSEQFTNGHYLRSLSDKAGVKPLSQSELSAPIRHANLQRLSSTAKRQELTFDDILGKVQQAYVQSVPIDEIIVEGISPLIAVYEFVNPGIAFSERILRLGLFAISATSHKNGYELFAVTIPVAGARLEAWSEHVAADNQRGHHVQLGSQNGISVLSFFKLLFGKSSLNPINPTAIKKRLLKPEN